MMHSHNSQAYPDNFRGYCMTDNIYGSQNSKTDYLTILPTTGKICEFSRSIEDGAKKTKNPLEQRAAKELKLRICENLVFVILVTQVYSSSQ